MWSRPRRSLSVFAFLIASSLASAQTFRGGINGTVLDTSGAAVPEAAVKATNDATGQARSAVTGGNGEFNIPDLPLGQYSLIVSKQGFQEQKLTGVEVAVSKISTVSVKLGLAQQSTLIEVSASAVVVETTSTALTGVVSTKVVEDLPMNGRDFRQMIKLAPGVSPSSTAINGNRTRGNNYQIDGADNNDAFQNASAVNQGGVAGIAGTLLPIEAIDQFAVQSGGSSEVGRNAGGAINLVLKSGTNSLHGSAFYFNRNEALAANSPFAAPGTAKRKIRNSQYGFSLGGPVIRNRTFFFLTGEAQNAVAANSTLVTAPSDAYVAQARDVLNRFGVPVNPVSVNLLSFYPARTRSAPARANNYLGADQSNYDSYNGVIKVDHRVTDKHNLSVRYFGGTGGQTALVDNSAPFAEYFQVAPSRMHNVSVILSSVLTPRLVNQLVLGTNYFKQTFNDNDISPNPIAAGLNTGVTDLILGGSPSIRITGFASASATQPLGRVDVTGHLTDTMSLNLGKHQLKLGGEYRKANLDIFYLTNKRGTFNFDGTRGPWDATVPSEIKPLADFLAGFVRGTNGATIVRGDVQRDYRQNTWDLYAHDNYQLSSKLNVNFGLRYSYFGTVYDTRNSITTFIPGRGIVAAGGDIDRLYPRDLNNFAPRFGFAYQPVVNGKTVIRGGYGIFYDIPAVSFFGANNGGNGGAAGVNANPGGPSPVYSITRSAFTLVPGESVFGTAAPAPPFGVLAISQDFRTPYVQNFNLNVQRQLAQNTVLQVGYVGSLGHKLPLLRDINQPLPGTTGTLLQRRPYYAQYPTLGVINQLESIGNSNYNSLQISLNQTMWHGLIAQVAYTYGHAIDNGSEARNTLPANSYNLRAEHGNAAFDLRHAFVGYVSYTIPTFSQKLPKWLVAGWQANSLITLHTGSPFEVRAGTDVSVTGEGVDRVDLIGDPFAGIQQPTSGTSVRYFNPAAFARPAAGTFGNLGRNSLFGPGFKSVDPSLFKNTRLTERLSAQLRFEVFNIFNSTNYANPTASLSSGSNGLISSTRNGGGAPGLGVGEPRNCQVALKLIW